MIERASFTNFKSLREVSISLGRFMVIVGPNGSGKTSILDGLLYLAQATKRKLDSVMTGVFDPGNLLSRGATSAMALELSGHFEGTEAHVRIGVVFHEKEEIIVIRRWGRHERTLDRLGNIPQSKRAAESTKGAKPSISAHTQSAFAKYGYENAGMRALSSSIGSARKLRLDIEQLAAASYSDEETPTLQINGAGMASVLADLAGRSPETFQSIQQAACAVVPTLERIRTQRARVTKHEAQQIIIDDKPIVHAVERPIWGQQVVLDFKGAPNIPAPLSSEGTLLAIGLLTALWTVPRPRLLLLDDIDKALHPRAQGELVAQLRKVLEMDPALQIIATSHSPYLLDHFEPHEVLITALRSDGSTACAPLTDHPDFERWKGTTRAGELWSFVGEDWVIAQADAKQPS